jgi:stage V sporulation protein T
MLEQLNASLLQQDGELEQTRTGGENLQELLAGVQQELKETKRQRIRDILRHPGQEELLEETYDELEEELARRISGLQRQLALTMDRRDTILQANRAAKPALEVFDDLLSKQRLDREDLELVVERIRVGEGCIEVMLKPDIDALLQGDDEAGSPHAHACGRGLSVTQAAAKHTDRVFSVNLISEGDPLEIFTDKDGGVVFKKYSLMGDLQIVASQICETVCKTSGCSVVICDRDSVIACAGVNRREVMERHISSALEGIMEARQVYQHRPGAAAVPLLEDSEGTFTAALAAPILTEGDVMGCVVFSEKEQGGIGEAEYKLAQTIAAFLGKHMES